MVTIEKAVFTSVSIINGKPKITLTFSNGEVYTFIEGIDNCFKTIVNLVNMKRKAYNITFTTDNVTFKENRKGVYLVYKLNFTGRG